MPCYSREFNEAAGPDARRGYVTGQIAALAPSAERDIAYLCGNPDMVDAAFEALKAAGLAVPQIRREKYVSGK
jgi:NAD(P)H-flavin reductase